MTFGKNVRALKIFGLMGLCSLVIASCGSADGNKVAPAVEPSEYFMTYKVNGQRFTLDQAVVKTRKNEVRYSIEGASGAQGDINVVVIRHNDGPPREGTFGTNERNLVFMLGGEDGEATTLELMSHFRGGEFTITEITDTYAKGSFHFTANDSAEGSRRNFIVTDGLFKAKIMTSSR